MRSAILVVLFVAAAISVSLDIGYIRDLPSTSSSASGLSLFGVKVTNDENIPIQNVQYFLVPLNFFGIGNVDGNGVFFPGSLHTINVNATGSEGFTVATAQLAYSPVVLVTVFYFKNGVLLSACGTFYLNKTDTYKRSVADAIEIVEETTQNFARDQYYSITPASFNAIVNTQTWNQLNFKSNYGNLNSFSYTAACNDPANSVDIGYQADGTNLNTVGQTAYKASSISLMGGYPPNGPGDFWNITIYCTFKIGTNTTYTNTQSVRKFYIGSGGSKRSAEKDQGFTAVTATLSSHYSGFAMKAEYSIAIAVAGVVVAAIAVIAAIVIVRRRPQPISTL